MGMKYLTALQLTERKDPTQISELDAEFNTTIASFLVRITRGERQLLAKLLSLAVRKVVQDIKETNDGTTKVSVPTTENELRRYVEGRYSMLNNIPIPLTNVLPNGDTYILPSDFLRLYFALGCLQPHMILTEKDIPQSDGTVFCSWQSQRAREILKRHKGNDCHKVLMCEWSDGFDPNRKNKDNRGSVHITTLSLLGYKNHNDRNLSFPITVASNKSDLIEIRRKIYEDIKLLEKPTPFFDGKKVIMIQFFLLVSIKDRPKRSKATGFGSHNGKFTGRWGWVTNFSDKLISCNKCQQERCGSVRTGQSRSCRSCYDWSYEKVKIELPPNYPIEKASFQSHPVTHSSLKKAALHGHSKCTAKKGKNWSMKEATAYMTTKGLNGNLVKSIISANNKQDLMAVLPPCWDSLVDFQSHIETIMHMCFLGVSQTVGMVIKTVLNKGQLYTKFHSGDNHLKNIWTLQLDFCKCWIFGSQNTPFGPWVSENTLGYVRIMKLLYSNILDELKNDKIRKLSKQVIQSWVSVVARVMQDAVDNELLSDIDRHVKNFLTILCKLEQEVDSGNKHKIETTSNLAGLLNITTFMKEVGPLRLYWEGGYKGEGLLRYIKPLVKQGIHKPTFAKNLFNKYYSDRFLQLVLGLDIQYDEDDTETVPMER